MRFLLAISTLGALAVGLAPVGAQSRTSSSGLTRRISSDTCAFIHGPFNVVHYDGQSETLGIINTCACISDIPILLTTIPLLGLATTAVGQDAVTAILTNMITTTASTCNYPDNAIPVCEIGHPCGYTCGNGFTRTPGIDECVCQSPNTVCGGQCKSSCPSAIPVPVVPVVPERRAASAYDRVANRRRMCPRGYTACGIFEQRGKASEPWECVDVRHDLESCGGCMTPFDDLSPRGVDCTAIPGVADVSCMQGSCVVRRCISGCAVTADGSRCISTK